MCGRYFLDESPELRPFVEEMNRSPLVAKFQNATVITTQGEVRPTNIVPVIASNRSGKRTVFPMRWGFAAQTLLINARAETAADKPLFREAWASHRCIVPASYYFEWEHFTDNSGRKRTGPKYLLQPRNSPITFLCGLYRIEASLPVFVILTRQPSADISFIHDRMPLMVGEELVADWVRPTSNPAELAKTAITDMYYEKVDDEQLRLI